MNATPVALRQRSVENLTLSMRITWPVLLDHGLDDERDALSCHLMPWLIVEASDGIAQVVSVLSVQCSSLTALENDWCPVHPDLVRLAGFADAC